MSNAAGTRAHLFTSERFATAQMTGHSRSVLTPETCSALSARSSPSTPAVFFVATFVIAATSSSSSARSSNSVKSDPPDMRGV